VSVSTGYYNNCVVTSGGTLQCWGYNGYGNLGDGTTKSSSTLVTATLSSVIAVAVGEGHTCALTTAGAVECIGYNSNGQLGNGKTSFSATTTWQVAIASGAIGVAAGYSHTCALMASGKVYCWGANGNGQLGDGTNIQRTSPVLVSGF
jgi:alpha-tubulin suppressor-like RCC1 family protein